MFSIIIPLYNKAQYVRRTIESVLAQTYTDYECIIMDDGSTDGSAEVVQCTMQNAECRMQNAECTMQNAECTMGEKIRLLSQSNQGVAVARNNAVRAASGEYICFLDADDWWEPTFLEEMTHLIQVYPKAGLYATNYIYYKTGKTHVALDMPTGYIDYPKAYLQSTAMPVWTGAVAMPRRVFLEMGGFPQGVRLGEDFLLWARTAMHYPVAFLNRPLAYYNNDVPTCLRATRHLHAPEYHMTFLLDTIAPAKSISAEWKRLFDHLRVNSLLDYWLSPQYHDAAKAELGKVDWSQQPCSVIRTYRTPIFLLRANRRIRQIGSWCKQRLYKILYT